MRPIRSIIVFNSATAGDFLTSLCWSQLESISDKFDQKESGRMCINNTYFKSTSCRLFYAPTEAMEFDHTLTHPVENSHYWLDCYRSMADRCVFIDYPEKIQKDIMAIYLEKVFDNDRQKMIQENIRNQSAYIASRTTIDNIDQILNIQWQKNIRSWRNNAYMSPVSLADFFDRNKIEAMVELLTAQELKDRKTFNTIYDNWIARNDRLYGLF